MQLVRYTIEFAILDRGNVPSNLGVPIYLFITYLLRLGLGTLSTVCLLEDYCLK